MVDYDPDVTTASERCSLAMARRVAAMLDLDPATIQAGAPLPRGWHFILMASQTQRRDLRSDGFPGLGLPLPDLDLPRLLLAGRTVQYVSDLPIGAEIVRSSWVSEIKRRDDAKGRRALVTISSALQEVGSHAPAIVETQSYMMLPAGGRFAESAAPAAEIVAEHSKVQTPDSTLLFQYSALGFNSHRIHLDRDYARDVEGYPDLVVNGGLTTLLLTEFARRDLKLTPIALRMKNTAPLFSGRPLTLAATREDTGWRLRVHDHTGVIAADAELDVA